MTQDEIIEMARQAKAIPMHKDFNQLALIGTENIETFAKLVALRYQKKIADLENIICQHHWDVLQEREACAKVCEDISNTRANMNAAWRNGCRDVATEIRARGQT